MCCVGFEPLNKGGSAQGLGDWKAPVCATHKNPQPMKRSEINPSPATRIYKTVHKGGFLLESQYIQKVQKLKLQK